MLFRSKTTLESLIQDIFYRSDVYRFTLDAAHKRINFSKKEVKHFESPFAGKPFILTLCQKAIAEAIFGFYIFDIAALAFRLVSFHVPKRFRDVLLTTELRHRAAMYQRAGRIQDVMATSAIEKKALKKLVPRISR